MKLCIVHPLTKYISTLVTRFAHHSIIMNMYVVDVELGRRYIIVAQRIYDDVNILLK